MHVRRRALSAGAVLAAAAGIVLSPTPAQADCGGADHALGQAADQRQATRWQVGMQLGSAPVSLTGTGGPPALLLGALPASTVSVEDVRGQNLLRLNASARLPEAPRPTFSDNLANGVGQQLPDGLDVAAPVDGAHERAEQPGARVPAIERAAQQATATPERVAPPSVAAPTEVPLQVPGADSVLGGSYAWVPIGGLTGLGPDAGGLPWTGGIALAVLAGGAGAVTVVARHRRTSAG